MKHYIYSLLLFTVFVSSATAFSNPFALRGAVHFNGGSSVPTDSKQYDTVYTEAAEFTAKMQSKPDTKIFYLVGSSTCDADGKKTNELAKQRSKTVVDELIRRGMGRLFATSFDLGRQSHCKTIIFVFATDPLNEENFMAELNKTSLESYGYLYNLH